MAQFNYSQITRLPPGLRFQLCLTINFKLLFFQRHWKLQHATTEIVSISLFSFFSIDSSQSNYVDSTQLNLDLDKEIEINCCFVYEFMIKSEARTWENSVRFKNQLVVHSDSFIEWKLWFSCIVNFLCKTIEFRLSRFDVTSFISIELEDN